MHFVLYTKLMRHLKVVFSIHRTHVLKVPILNWHIFNKLKSLYPDDTYEEFQDMIHMKLFNSKNWGQDILYIYI